jgi:hypothetical protein
LKWKCDTSNDEVVGHYFAYLTVAELLAETAEEKDIVTSLVDNITSTIVKNNYTLVDITGKVTTWGNFDPVEITGFLLTGDCPPPISLSRAPYEHRRCDLHLHIQVSLFHSPPDHR